MENTLKTFATVTSQSLDMTEHLGLKSAIGLFQDIATDHSMIMGADRWTLLDKCNSFWVVTKIKLKILDMPRLNDNMLLETWPLKPSSVRFERDGRFFIEDKPMVLIKSQWVALNATTHKVTLSKMVPYPQEMENREDRSFDEEFSILDFDVADKDRMYTKKIRFSDLDLNNHVNNTFYVDYILDCFSSKFLKENNIDTFEIHFQNECFEGDNLDLYKLETNQGTFIEGKVEDRIIIKSFIKWKK